ncbi:MAG: DUF86 domain-containing protein [Sedimentisphaerales bacterium]|nr:DUF86 domain-containing protein [Sedimentisphaerales bacterium]
MSKRSVELLLDDVCEAIDKIEQYISGMSFDVFSKDNKTIDAVVRNLEIIGEASNRLPADFKDSHPQIEWYKVVGLRHRIVHEYFGIDLQIVWQILQKDLPALQDDLSQIRG